MKELYIDIDSNIFFNYIVYNPGYRIYVGGGLYNCRGLNGEGPGACKMVGLKPPSLETAICNPSVWKARHSTFSIVRSAKMDEVEH